MPRVTVSWLDGDGDVQRQEMDVSEEAARVYEEEVWDNPRVIRVTTRTDDRRKH